MLLISLSSRVSSSQAIRKGSSFVHSCPPFEVTSKHIRSRPNPNDAGQGRGGDGGEQGPGAAGGEGPRRPSRRRRLPHRQGRRFGALVLAVSIGTINFLYHQSVLIPATARQGIEASKHRAFCSLFGT